MLLRRLVAFILLLAPIALAQTKRPFTFVDMMALKRVGDPTPSPDGKWVVFPVQDVDLEKNTKATHLWIMPAGGGEARQISQGPGEDGPRWSPDGKSVLYISARDGESQVWVSDFDSARGIFVTDPRKVSSISTGADGAIWSPDGKNILFTSSVYPDCPSDACNQQRNDERNKSKVKAQIFTRLFYRHWSTYTYGKRTHLFVVPAEGGTARDITPGDHDVPPFSLGGQALYAISPDGKEVAFTSNIDELESVSTNNEVFIVPISGGTPKKISTAPGSDSTPLYSPDGKWIAWRMQMRNGYESDRFRLVLYNRLKGQIKNLTESFDQWVEAFAWAPKSDALYFVSEYQGEAPLYRIGINGGKPTLVQGGHVDSPAVSPDGATIFVTGQSIAMPNEIFAIHDGRGTAMKTQLTHINTPVLSQVAMSQLEPFWFNGALKTKVHGFLLKPPQFEPGKKYPVKFLIHGGPQGAWGDSWTYRWNAQLFAADGYVVVMINPRGSTGYGQKFIDEINGDWGGKPYEDLMAGLDYVAKTYPFIDGQRVCAMGASYGGYMVNWMLGHTNRFKCFVSHDGQFNTISAYGTTEELWFPEWEFQGTPWTNRATYEKWSPNNYATNFKTPTLVVHGQLDYRLDVSEGFQLFTYLQRLKVPSKMLYFPDEGHWVLKPQNSQLWYKTVNEWVDSHLKK
ncbi:MAG TPA: S9 family peptidase [Terriglobales bacterium]|nr:S9 family peptidase [Terriglobales bacterium]